MNVADVIINTRDREFSNIIEFYRENHKDGYTDDYNNNLSTKDLKIKRKKKSKRGIQSLLILYRK